MLSLAAGWNHGVLSSRVSFLGHFYRVWLGQWYIFVGVFFVFLRGWCTVGGAHRVVPGSGGRLARGIGILVVDLRVIPGEKKFWFGWFGGFGI